MTWTDSNGATHYSAGDEVSEEGIEHIYSCRICMGLPDLSRTLTLPPQEGMTTKQASIAPSVREHANCWRLDHSGPMTWWGTPGDVKRCPHGKIMIRCEVGPNSTMAGPGTDYWRTLSPIFDPIKYRKAKKALA